MRINRSEIRKAIIREMYNTSLMQIFEQAPPADPAAAAAAPAAAPPAADPAAAAAAPVDPAAGMFGAPDPAAAAAPAAAPPAVDPAAAAAAPPAVPAAAPAAVPAAAPAAAPAPGAAPAPAPGAPAAGDAAKKKAKAPDPEREPVKAQVNKALMKATSKASDTVATESLRRRSLRFLFEQDKADEEASIDMGVYAGEIAKLIKNYTSLVDVKKNVISQAEEYLDDEFPKDADSLKKQLKDLLRKDYHISLERPEPPSDSYAVGAKSGGGGAA